MLRRLGPQPVERHARGGLLGQSARQPAAAELLQPDELAAVERGALAERDVLVRVGVRVRVKGEGEG